MVKWEIMCIFAHIKDKDYHMKDRKQYSFGEDENSPVASEPVGYIATSAAPMISVDNPTIPGLPETWNELIDDLKQGEAEFEHGEVIPWDVATKNIRTHIADYVV